MPDPLTAPRTRKPSPNALNLLVAGHARSGKSSFIATLFETINVHRLHFPRRPGDASAVNAAASASSSSLASSASGNMAENGAAAASASAPATRFHPLSLVELQLALVSSGAVAPGIPLPPRSIPFPAPSPASIECCPPGSKSRVLLHLIDSPGLEIPSALLKPTISNDPSAERAAAAYLDPILRYIDAQFEATLAEETKVRRNPRSPDFQTHLCVFMFNPEIVLAANGLSVVDRMVLRTLASRVNLIPCIGKSDLLTVRQIKRVRELIAEQLLKCAIPVYAFPEEEEDGDEIGSSPDEVRPKRVHFERMSLKSNSDSIKRVDAGANTNTLPRANTKNRASAYPAANMDASVNDDNEITIYADEIVQSEISDAIHYSDFDATVALEDGRQGATSATSQLRSMVPFRIINSEETESDSDGLPLVGLSLSRQQASPNSAGSAPQKLLGREYLWGVVQVQNPDFCDFSQLINAIFITHAEELRLRTREILYENWRTHRLTEIRNKAAKANRPQESLNGQATTPVNGPPRSVNIKPRPPALVPRNI